MDSCTGKWRTAAKGNNPYANKGKKRKSQSLNSSKLSPNFLESSISNRSFLSSNNKSTLTQTKLDNFFQNTGNDSVSGENTASIFGLDKENQAKLDMNVLQGSKKKQSKHLGNIEVENATGDFKPLKTSDEILESRCKIGDNVDDYKALGKRSVLRSIVNNAPSQLQSIDKDCKAKESLSTKLYSPLKIRDNSNDCDTSEEQDIKDTSRSQDSESCEILEFSGSKDIQNNQWDSQLHPLPSLLQIHGSDADDDLTMTHINDSHDESSIEESSRSDREDSPKSVTEDSPWSDTEESPKCGSGASPSSNSEDDMLSMLPLPSPIKFSLNFSNL